MDTIGQCFGVIFSTFLLDLNASSVITAWIFNLYSFTWCLTGSALGSLLAEFGWRKITMAAALLLSSATVMNAFVTKAWMLFITYSLCSGMCLMKVSQIIEGITCQCNVFFVCTYINNLPLSVRCSMWNPCNCELSNCALLLLPAPWSG